jgi:cell division septation protein DedD
MKKIALILVFSAFVMSEKAFSQSKEEKALKKEWAKKMKDTDPLDFKKLVEDKESLSQQVLKLSAQQTEFDSKVSAKEAEVLAAKAETEKLKTELEEAKASAAAAVVETAVTSEVSGTTTKTTQTTNKGTKTSTSTSRGATPGVVYKVQIGSFKNKDLSKYFENNKNFSGEVDSDGTKKYTLGNFSEYWEADNFKKYLREMGVKDAWIVPYKDGQRVNIKDVLEGAI